MDTKTLAAILTGWEHPLRITNELREVAKCAGLVIVYGASDDLMEFDGAIYDEIGAYGGTEVWVDATGLVPDFDSIDKSARDGKDRLRDYFKREGSGRKISAIWSDEGAYSWTYRTDIPHETFEIFEDGEPYCRGIVFALADVSKP